MNTKCSICNFKREKCFQTKLLHKYEVDYFFCENCGFLQTEEPYWLDEAYDSAIADTDTGLVQRNIGIANKLASILYFLFDKDGKYLDMAGGYGLLTRLMRDIGFDFYWSDRYCQNIFAKGFDSTNTSKTFSAVTAFEVLEHIYDPLDFIQQALKETQTSTIIFSTELFKGQPPTPTSWWYYTPETGQHISFFQNQTLNFIANKLSLNIYSCKDLHVLTDRQINPILFRILVSRISNFSSTYVQKNMISKTYPDRERICQVSSQRN